MSFAYPLVVLFTAINFVFFATSSVSVFDNRGAVGKWQVFKGVWAVTTACIMWAEWRHPTTTPWRLYAGCVLLAGSLALYLYSARSVRKQPFTIIFSRDVPTRLVTEGPYRVVRHPFYTAYSLTYVACALLSDHVVTSLCMAAMVSVYLLAARAEERKFLASDLANQYAHYRARTGMFFPWFSTQD